MVAASNALKPVLKFRAFFGALAAGLSLAACASAAPPAAAGATYGFVSLTAPRASATQTQASAGAARLGGVYKLGAPYQAAGLWYVPAVDEAYDVEGLAGTYGEGLEGKVTANGETFSAAAFTGAHATLPMPAIVEVTNLQTGKSLRVRLNDRGANKPGRVIDLSRAAADALGVQPKGTAKVRVRYVGPARLDSSTEPLYAVNTVAKPVPAAPAAPSPATTAFAVQAGAFSDPARADAVAMRLARTGPAAVRPVEVSGRTLYRVVVGNWGEADVAEAARDQVAELGFADAKVVRGF